MPVRAKMLCLTIESVEQPAFDLHAGACQGFAAVLGPDYNAAHRDHFHRDQARRGAMGWRACR